MMSQSRNNNQRHQSHSVSQQNIKGLLPRELSQDMMRPENDHLLIESGSQSMDRGVVGARGQSQVIRSAKAANLDGSGKA